MPEPTRTPPAVEAAPPADPFDWLVAGGSPLGRLLAAGAGSRLPDFLTAVLDAVPDGIAVVDADRRRVFENRAMRERFDEARRASAYLDGDARTDLGLECPAASALADGVGHHVVRELRLPDGERVYLELASTPLRAADGRVVGALMIVRDETRRVSLERERQRHAARLEQAVEARTAELHRAKETLQRILDGIPAAISLLDASTGATLFRNRAAASLPAEVTDAVLRSLCRGREAERLPMPTSARLVEHVDGQGEVQVFEAFAYPVPAPNEGRTLDIVYARDITLRRRLEAQAIRNERLAVVGELAAGLAHEVRTPLTSISNSVRLLEGALPPDAGDEARLVLGIIAKESRRLSGLLTDFLRFARPRPPEPVATDLNALVRGVVDLARRSRAQAEHVAVRLDLADDLAAAPVDPDQLRQALLNVVVNAIDAAAAGLEAGPGAGRAAAEVMVRTHGPGEGAFGWSIAVADTGPGIEAADLPRLFEPFFSKGKCDGTGLGLAIAKRIVEAHAGRIDVASVPGSGATFIVTLPAASGSAPLEGA